MAQSKGITQNKTKGFTFRITQSLADDIASVKTKCKQHGIRWNATEALTVALERELKSVQKHIQNSVDDSWEIGQSTLDLGTPPTINDQPERSDLASE